MIKKLYTIFGILIAIGALTAFGLYTYANNIWSQPTQAIETNFIIDRGKSLSWTANELEKQGVIPNAFIFKLFHKLKKQAAIKAGEYDLSNTVSQQELMQKLISGDVISYQVTLIDGWTFKQFKQHLAKQDLLKKEINDKSDTEILTAIGATETHPEGLFAPETYAFQKGNSDLDILKRSYQRQKTLLSTLWEKLETKPEHINTPYKALILASIIEKETGQAGERDVVSGVFHNRLRIGMKLQTDPTVIYGMGDSFDGNIRRKDLRTDTIYNTYTRYGLPPTPIAMPGIASIEAAMNPAETKYLYFVGKGDGSHYFSKNLKEHNQAVRKYQLGQ
jgi:UPF0755 protein